MRKQLTDGSTSTPREIALLVCVSVRALGDCSIAWGSNLAALANPSVAAKVLRALDAPGLTTREAALRRWIDQVVAGPNGTGAAQVDALRAAGFSEREVFEATVYVAFRVAFATVNDAFGARPDAQLLAAAPPEVRAAVTYGR